MERWRSPTTLGQPENKTHLAQQKLLENTTHRMITVIKSWGLFIIENYVLADPQCGLSFFPDFFF